MTIRAAALLLLGALLIVVPVSAQTQNPDFEKTVSRLDKGGAGIFYMELNGRLEGFVNRFEPIALHSGAPQGMIIFAGVKAALKTLGLFTLDDYGMSTVLLDDGRVLNRSILRVTSRTGLFALLGDENARVTCLGLIPQNAGMAMASHFRFGDLWDLLLRTARASTGAVGETVIRQMLQSAKQQHNIDLEEVFKSLGNEFGAYAVSAAGDGEAAGITGAFFLQTKNTKLFELVAYILGQSGTPAQVRQVGGRDAVVISLPREAAEIMGDDEMVIGQAGDWFAVTLGREEFEALAARKLTDQGLRGNPGFQSAIKDHGDQFSGMSYVSKELMKVFFKLMEEMGSEMHGANQPMFKFYADGIHNDHIVLAYQEPDGFRSVEVADEITASNAADTVLIMPVAAVGLGAAVAVPAFLRARESSRVRACQENLSKLDGAKQQWALEEKKDAAAEPTWGDLVGGNKYLRRTPVCPAGGTYHINSVGEQPTCSIGASGLPGMDHSLPPTSGSN